MRELPDQLVISKDDAIGVASPVQLVTAASGLIAMVLTGAYDVTDIADVLTDEQCRTIFRYDREATRSQVIAAVCYLLEKWLEDA